MAPSLASSAPSLASSAIAGETDVSPQAVACQHGCRSCGVQLRRELLPRLCCACRCPPGAHSDVQGAAGRDAGAMLELTLFSPSHITPAPSILPAPDASANNLPLLCSQRASPPRAFPSWLPKPFPYPALCSSGTSLASQWRLARVARSRSRVANLQQAPQWGQRWLNQHCSPQGCLPRQPSLPASMQP